MSSYRVPGVVRAAEAGVALHARAVHLTLAAVPRDVAALEHVPADPSDCRRHRSWSCHHRRRRCCC